MDILTIGKYKVGPGHPTFIIAEAGVNHNGDPELARRLIDAAREAGADAVKFQTFKARDGSTRNVQKVKYQANNTGNEDSMYEMVRKLELPYEEFNRLKDYCDEVGIMFLSTPHTPTATPFLADLVPVFKLGSGDINNLPFLRDVASHGLPVIFGTGMSTMEEVKTAVRTLREGGAGPVAALHCTTSYPCAFTDVNLRAMLTMEAELDCLVGYSDHTPGITVPVMAVAMGAHVIEKHFTLDKSLPGPDHKASLEPDELKAMVKAIREAEAALGNSEKKPVPVELEIRDTVRKSIVAQQNIPAGTVLTEELLIIKRPGTGIQPADYERVLGKTTSRAIEGDTLVQWEDLQ